MPALYFFCKVVSLDNLSYHKDFHAGLDVFCSHTFVPFCVAMIFLACSQLASSYLKPLNLCHLTPRSVPVRLSSVAYWLPSISQPYVCSLWSSHTDLSYFLLTSLYNDALCSMCKFIQFLLLCWCTCHKRLAQRWVHVYDYMPSSEGGDVSMRYLRIRLLTVCLINGMTQDELFT